VPQGRTSRAAHSGRYTGGTRAASAAKLQPKQALKQPVEGSQSNSQAREVQFRAAATSAHATSANSSSAITRITPPRTRHSYMARSAASTGKHEEAVRLRVGHRTAAGPSRPRLSSGSGA